MQFFDFIKLLFKSKKEISTVDSMKKFLIVGLGMLVKNTVIPDITLVLKF